MSKKTTIYLLKISLLLALIAITGLGCQWIQEKAAVREKPTTSSQETSQPAAPRPSAGQESHSTSHWQSYVNRMYEFRVRYPEDWHIKEEPVPVYADTFTLKVNFIDPSAREKGSISVRPKGDEGMIREALNIVSETTVKVGDVEGVRITGIGHKEGTPPIAEVFITLMRNEPYLYIFEGEGDIFNKILSTFAFIQ